MAEAKKSAFKKLNFTDKKQGFAVLLLGILAAIILSGLAYRNNWPTAWMFWLLAIGVVVGILNIFHKEAVLFLISGLAIAFMLNLMAGIALFPAWAVTSFNAVVYLLAPANVVVGLKVIYALAAK